MVELLEIAELYLVVAGFIVTCLLAYAAIQGITIGVIKLIEKAFDKHEETKERKISD